MNLGKPRITDLAEVLVRACHHREDHPRIFSDPYAQRLLTDSEREFIETRWLEASGDRVPSHRTHAVRSALREMPLPAIMLARAQYSEEQLFTSVQLCGARQYVQIEAGMDSFAFRRPDM